MLKPVKGKALRTTFPRPNVARVVVRWRSTVRGAFVLGFDENEEDFENDDDDDDSKFFFFFFFLEAAAGAKKA